MNRLRVAPVIDLSEFLNKNRPGDANSHMEIGYYWHELGKSNELHLPLGYAASEYRCAIERILLELFSLMAGLRLSPQDIESLRSIHDIISAMKDFVKGNSETVERFIRFNTIYVTYQSGIRLSEPDVQKLLKFWKSLSVYCHAQKMPEDTWNSTQWIKDGYSCLEAVLEYLKAITKYRGFIQISSLPPEAIELLNFFVANKVDEEALKTRLKLMKPIIEARAKK
ncbi:MAG: hypothetical protein IH823_00705 [Candidatus Dadabacteria bacterium]|nr:hypothetical protein [Candidatus Dadabacteria bacterium]